MACGMVHGPPHPPTHPPPQPTPRGLAANRARKSLRRSRMAVRAVAVRTRAASVRRVRRGICASSNSSSVECPPSELSPAESDRVKLSRPEALSLSANPCCAARSASLASSALVLSPSPFCDAPRSCSPSRAPSPPSRPPGNSSCGRAARRVAQHHWKQRRQQLLLRRRGPHRRRVHRARDQCGRASRCRPPRRALARRHRRHRRHRPPRRSSRMVSRVPLHDAPLAMDQSVVKGS